MIKGEGEINEIFADFKGDGGAFAYASFNRTLPDIPKI